MTTIQFHTTEIHAISLSESHWKIPPPRPSLSEKRDSIEWVVPEWPVALDFELHHAGEYAHDVEATSKSLIYKAYYKQSLADDFLIHAPKTHTHSQDDILHIQEVDQEGFVDTTQQYKIIIT
jgi:hypothetical protein